MHSTTILAVFGRYVFVRMQPPLTDELVRRCLAGVATLVDQAGAGQILGIMFDLRGTQTTDRASLIDGLLRLNGEKYRMYKQTRLAVVFAPDDCHFDFSEPLSLKGEAPVRFFKQECLAREWLKESDPI